MRRWVPLMIACALIWVGFAPGTLPVADAAQQERIVWPYGQTERWVPVVAGFKVVPPPVQCDADAGDGPALFETSFEPGDPMLDLAAPWTASSTLPNLWHVTDTAGHGTEAGHDGAGRLYFGVDSEGTFETNTRVAGAAAFPVALPEDGAVLSFSTKWEVEWFEGYDHMWVELQDETGQVYVLCTVNAEGRGDPSSSGTTTVASCSPYHLGMCPTGERLLNGFGVTRVLDDAAPHWETRAVVLPDHFGGQTVQVRFAFDSSDPVANTFLGWMIDDVAVHAVTE